MTDQEPKLCINCKWIATNYSKDCSKYLCMAPQNKEKTVDLVTGAARWWIPLCRDQREISHGHPRACSAQGDWFEAALPKLSYDPVPKTTSASKLLEELL